MPNKIRYKGNCLPVRDVPLRFILDEALEVIRDLIASEPNNQWLLDIQKKWKSTLINGGHNCRDLSLNILIKDKVSKEQIIQILNQTKHNILSYGETVPSQDKRKPLLDLNYDNVDNAPTQRFADVIDSIIALTEE